MCVGCFFCAQPHASGFVLCCAFPKRSSEANHTPPHQSREDVPIQLFFFPFLLVSSLAVPASYFCFSFLHLPAAWATPLTLQPHTKNTHTRTKESANLARLAPPRLSVHLLAPVLVVTIQNKRRAANRRLLFSSSFPLPARPRALFFLSPQPSLLNSTSSCRPSWHRRWPCPRWRGDPHPPTCGSSPPGRW